MGLRRNIKRNKKRLDRKLFLETLENRTLLNGDTLMDYPISQQAQGRMTAGLDAMIDKFSELESYGQLAMALPVVDGSLGSVIDPSDIIHNVLQKPVDDYFGIDDTPTVGELVNILEGVNQQVSGFNLDALVPTVALVDGAFGQELVFAFDINASRNDTFDLSLNAIKSEFPLGFTDSTVEIISGFAFDLEFGIELSGSVPGADGFYIKNSDIIFSAAIDSDINAGVNIGMLGAEVRDGNLDLSASVSVSFVNADNDSEGKITRADMQAYAIEDLVNVSADSNMDSSFPVYVDLAGFEVNGDTVINVAGGFFDAQQIDVNLAGVNADEIEKFLTIDSSSFVNILSNLSDWMGKAFDNSSLMGALPVAQDVKFNDIITLPEKIDSLIDSYISSDIINSQQFAGFVVAQIGGELASVTANYNQGQNLLSYDVSLSSKLEGYEVPVGLNFDMGDLAFYDQAGFCQIDATGALDFTINIKLGKYEAEVLGARPLPTDGRLSSDAVFGVAVNGVEPINVVVERNDSVNNIYGLISHINNSLVAAGITDVEAENYSGYLKLIASGETQAQIVISADENNPACTELGLDTYMIERASNLSHISFKDLTMSIDASVSASDVQASAGVGFVGVELADINLSGQMGFDLEFLPARNGIYLTDLLSQATSSAAYRVTNDYGNVSLNVPTVSLKAGTDLQFDASPEISIEASDLLDNPVVNVEYQNFGNLTDLKSLAYTQVISMLEDVEGWLGGLESSGVLDFDLLVTDKSLSDLFSPAKELGELIESYAADPALSIQDLGGKLKGIFEDYAQNTVGGSLLDQSLINVEFVDNVLTVGLDMSYLLSEGYSLNLEGDLSSLGFSDSLSDLAFVQASGELDVELAANIDLSFGIDFNSSNPAVFVSDSSEIGFSINGQANDIDFDVMLGILGVHVIDGHFHIDDGTASHNDIQMRLGLIEDNDDHRYSIGQLASASRFTSVNDTNISAVIPIYFPGSDAGSYLGDINFAVSDILDPLNTTVLTGPDLSSYIAGIDIMDVLNVGLDQALRQLNSLFETSVGSYELPIIGVSLKDTAGFLIDFLDNDQYGLTETLAGINSIAGVQNALLTTFGPAGFDVLGDLNVDGNIDISDIDVVSVVNGDDVDDVSFNVQLSQQLISEEFAPNFALDIPWLDLNIHDTGAVLFEVGYDLNLNFGVSRSDGFYVKTDQQDEFSVYFETSMPDLGAVGNLGFLSIEVGDSSESSSFFNGSLGVDLVDTDGILTVSDLFGDETASNILNITPEAQASLNLEFVTGIDGNDAFPALRGGFGFDWLINSSTGFPGQMQSSGFSDIQMNLGDYIGDFVEPVLSVINDVMEPIRPIVEALTTEIDFEIASYSVMDILSVFGDGDYSAITEFVTALGEIDTFIQQINSVDGSLWMDFGGVDLGLGTDNTVSAQSWQEPQQDVSQQLADNAPGFAADISATSSFLSFPIIDDPQNLLGILFGQNPTLVKCDLPDFSLNESFDQILGVIPVGPVPVTIGLRGSLGIASDISFGYDTLGLRNAYADSSGFALMDGFYVSDTDSNGRDIPELEVYGSIGFYGQVGGGFDFGFISAEASAGVEGGLKTTVTADLADSDGDGKVRFDEFSGFDLDGEISCYVDLYAKVSASFLGFGGSDKYTYELVDITLIDFTISNDASIYNPPVLATMDNGTLYLNMGDRASYALNGGEKPFTTSTAINGFVIKNYLDLDIGSDVAEEFEVVNSGSGTVIVKAWGFEQEYGSFENPITSIVANAGMGNDTIEINGGVIIPTYLDGGDGDDYLKGGSGVDTITGGSGSDYIDGSSGDDWLYGHGIDNYMIDAGEDTIEGGRGDDNIFGGGGNDKLYGQRGDDVIHGGGGADTILGEMGLDIIFGDAGADVLYGNQDSDIIYGGAGADIIIGGADKDYLYGYLENDFNNYMMDTDSIYGDFATGTAYIDLLAGDSGDDIIYGQGGNDKLFGEDGDDTIYAGMGDDSVDGGMGNDLLLGEDGNDDISGNAGNDYIYGGIGNDSINGSFGDDLIDGGSGNDVINGNDGADLIYAGPGNDNVNAGIGADIVYGGMGNDIIDGHKGDDIVYGQAGDDHLSGGMGDDSIICGIGNDNAFGQGGLDSIFGISGSNIIFGGDDNDVITGGSDIDIIDGQGGNDRIYGLSGADIIYGGLGNDYIDGGLANDEIYGNEGDDDIYGGLGDDELFGNAGNDYIDGGFGIDYIDGGIGADQLYAGYGSGDEIYGGAGDDIIHGSDDGIDNLYGGAGDDVIWGYQGNDYIEGNDGRDIIYGGAGDDILMGGLGADVILGQGGHDIIYGDSLTENSDATDYLYGDFGNDIDEPDSGRDQIFGQGGNDFIFGEGEDDKIVDAFGVNTISYGSGEGALPEAIVLPPETPNPELMEFDGIDSVSSLAYISSDDSSVWRKIAYTANSSQLVEPAIAASQTIDGQTYVAWVDSSYGKYDICLSMNVGGEWIKLVDGIGTELFGQDSIQSRQPSLVTDNDGDILISWIDYDAVGNVSVSVAKYDIDLSQLELLGNSISSSGDVKDSRIVVTDAGPVVFWLTNENGSNCINAKQYVDNQWVDFGNTLAAANSTTEIISYDVDVNGDNILLTWASDDSVNVLQWDGSEWQELEAINPSENDSMPTVKYYNDTIYLAWLQQNQGRQGIAVANYADGQWGDVQLFEASLNEIFNTPVLAFNNDGLQLTWLSKNTDDIDTVVMAWTKLDQAAGSFELPVYTELDSHNSIVDNYNSFDIAEGQNSFYAIWQDISSGISLAVNDGFESMYHVSAGSSIGQLLDDNDFGPGDVIYLEGGIYDGFEISADDAGVTIVGGQGFSSIISSQIIINSADDVILQNIQFNGNVSIVSSENVIVVANDFNGSALNLADTIDCSIENNTFNNGGIILGGSEAGVNIHGNYFIGGDIGIELASASSGSITDNNINSSGTGIDIQSIFVGLIADNNIFGANTGVNYNAAADLSLNNIYDCVVGMNVSVADRADAPGVYGSANGNIISNNQTGIVLENSFVANQTVSYNNVGVDGLGVLGGNDFTEANTLENNQVAVSLDAGSTIAYNNIGYNQIGISADSNQIITHNVLYNNSSSGIVINDADVVYIVNNTIYSEDGSAVHLANNSSQVEIVNNILWSENGYAINVSNDSREGFYSDYNVLYSGSQGHLVHWVVDFDDILDWQVDVGLFDANSIGRTDINPDWAKPRFSGVASNDYSLIDNAADLRFTSPAKNYANQAIDVGLSDGFINLLDNSNFESGLSGWTVSDGAIAVNDTDYAFEGGLYFAAGQSAQGSALQVVDLAAVGYSNWQIDQGDLFAVFGGRLKSANELFHDTGKIVLAFLDSSGQVIYDSEISSQGQHDRWELAGNRIAIPEGTRQIRYTYVADRQVENNDANNDACLDSAFLHIQDNRTSIDIGAFSSVGNDLLSPTISLRYPEMYVDWQRDVSHVISWDTFGNDEDMPVKIDLYQDTPDGSVYVQTIAETSDDGQYTWLPADSGVGYGDYGLRIFVSLIGSNITFDMSTESFNIPENTNEFYVNDNSTEDDQYTTAPGDNRNTGRTPMSPKPNPVNLLNVYSLGAGDTLFVDTGDYQLLYPVLLSGTIGIADDEGFIMSGPASQSGLAELSLIDPDFATTPTVILDNADYVTINNFVLSDGYTGLHLNNDSTYFTASNLICNNNVNDGIRVENGSSVSKLDNITASGNIKNGIGILSGQLQPELINITANNNGQYGLYATTAMSRLVDSQANSNGKSGFYLSGQGGVDIENVSATQNHTDGIYVNGPVDHVTGSEFYNNMGDGIDLYSNTTVTFENNQIYSNNGYGVNANSTTLQISGHDIFGNGLYGLRAGGNSVISDNNIYQNGSGISASNSFVSSNNVYNNADYGIYASGGTLEYNIVNDNGDCGIYLNSSAMVQHNVIHSNDVGIYAYSSGSVIANNRIYNNNSTGLTAMHNTEVRGNVIYSNALGVYASSSPYSTSSPFYGTIANNLIYDNSDGIVMENARQKNNIKPQIINNTIYQTSGYAISVLAMENQNSDSVQIKNNIITVLAGYGIKVDQRSQAALDSNFNLFDIAESGTLGYWHNISVDSLTEWQNIAFADANSIQDNPYYVNPAGVDGILGYQNNSSDGSDDNFHVQSLYQSVSSGSLAPVIDYDSDVPVYQLTTYQSYANQSPAIDRGDAETDFANEPSNNGGYVNIGAYGNTNQASTSPLQYILITSPQGGELWPNGQVFTINWRSDIDSSGELVDITLVGQNFEYKIAEDTLNDGNYAWQVPDSLAPGDYFITVNRSDDATISDNSNYFDIMAHDGKYYVNIENDSDFFDNEYTNASGNDANSGLTSSSPKPSVRAIIENYDLRPGDVIYVDTGNYMLSSNIIITSEDYGFTIIGPAQDGHHAVLNRNSKNSKNYVFEFDNACEVLLKNLDITGAYDGIYSDTAVNNLIIANNNIYNNVNHAVNLTGDIDNIKLQQNSIYTNEQSGIYIKDIAKIFIDSNNIYENLGYGIYIDNASATVTSNEVSGNDIGIYARANNLTFPVQISDNEVFSNKREGIYAEYNVLVMGNEVYGHQGANHYGIHVTRDARALYNESYGNEVGIYAGDPGYSRSATVVGNQVYNNIIGINAGYSSLVSENKSYSNGTGINAGNGYRFNGTISNNIIYANSDSGLIVNQGYTGVSIINNTIYNPAGNAVSIYNNSSDVKLQNNILSVESGYCISVAVGSFAGFASDYNVLHTASEGDLAKWGDTVIANRADWYYELGFDRHSYDSDPMFIDIDGPDNILGYNIDSSTNFGDDDNFHIGINSEAIDSGAPTEDQIFEMYPNGGRVNIGGYGNTFQATNSAPETVQIISPIALDKYEYGNDIYIAWRTSGITSVIDNITMTLEYTTDSGNSWHVFASALELESDGTGSYIWNANVVAEKIIVRISSDTGPNVSDESSIFQIAPGSNSYYVNIANDSNFDDNEYTLTSGDNTNSGKSPNSPMSSLSALLDIYDLGPGDIVYVDSGVYNVINNLVIDSSDAGVAIIGPTEAGHEALFDRNDISSGSNVLELLDADNVVIENMSFTGGYHGIYVSGSQNQSGPVLKTNNVYGNNSYGIFIDNSIATVTSNKVSGNDIGIYARAHNLTFPVQISDNEVFSNDQKGIYAEYNVLVTGNKVYGHQGVNHYGIHVSNNAKALYNESYGNEVGIYAGQPGYSRSATVVGNQVYNNSIGINAGYSSLVSENKSYSNGTGINAGNGYRFNGTISNNIIYANSDYGLTVNQGQAGASIVNNTIYQPIGDAVRIYNNSSDVKLQNNILSVESGYCINVAIGSFAGFASDYNVLHTVADGNVAKWGDTVIANRADWYYELGFDRHSYDSNPMFIDIDGPDNILGYDIDSSTNFGDDDNFHISINSEAIDSGSPTEEQIFEMYPNGDRVNIGGYGNTFEATNSAPETVQIISPIALDKYEYGNEIYIAWRTSGLAAVIDDIVMTLEYSTDTGNSWHVFASALELESDGTGSYIWNANVVAEEIIVRISSDTGPNVSDESSIFQIAPGSNSYYVNIANDSNFDDNEYTLTSGDNTNSGKSPNSPMSSLSALLDIYDLGPGDIVYVDSGVYNVINNLVIDSSDAGVAIIGPTEAGHEALFDRNDISSGSNVLELLDADNVVIENMSFTGGYHGIYVSGSQNQSGPVLKTNNVYGNNSYGIYIDNSIATVTSNNVSGNDIGIYARGNNLTFPVQLSDNEVFSNDREGIYAEYNVLVTGNKVYGHQGANHYGIHVTRDARALYNESYGNEVGIYAGDPGYSRSATVVGNQVYNNIIGINAGYSSLVSENKSYSNGTGINAGNGYRFNGTISNNIIYANSDYGLTVNQGQAGASIVNNTIYQPIGDAVRIYNNSSDVKLANNIFMIDTGHCINIEAGSNTGLASDYNLFYRTVSINSYIARVGLVDYADLVQWQNSYSQDSSSVESDPLFVDIDGADGVIGYQESAIHINNGLDDNFVLSKNSPAIDAGHSWMFDAGIDFSSVLDDPGVDNTGSVDYYFANADGSFIETGDSMNWRSANYVWSFDLPSSFNFYGIDYDGIYVSSSGIIQFGSNSSLYSDASSVQELSNHTVIAPYWGDIDTNGADDNIYIDTTQAGVVVIRWDATSRTDGSDVDFAVALFDTGKIESYYENIASNANPIIGISSGKGKYELVNSSEFDSQVTEIAYNLLPGFADIGAYEFIGSSLDETAPMVINTNPVVINNSGQGDVDIDQISVIFSEAINAIDALSVSNYTLLSFGPNQIEGDADDYTIGLRPVYNAGTSIVNLDIPSGQLADGVYKFIINGDSMRDVSGLSLANDYTRQFEIVSETAGPMMSIQASEVAVELPLIVQEDSETFSDVPKIMEQSVSRAVNDTIENNMIDEVLLSVSQRPAVKYNDEKLFSNVFDSGRASSDMFGRVIVDDKIDIDSLCVNCLDLRVNLLGRTGTGNLMNSKLFEEIQGGLQLFPFNKIS
ncbi:MAG: right-handed parallel beta-helix repeat-containing protein [Phycisphaerae bacterium]|nr:right-handed parallel beta-helix repeat-containing protein [Phycisphaerae bacterium]